MNILMIGNGFDLEHELPTKYEQFLEFIRKFRIAYTQRFYGSGAAYDIEDPYLKEIFSNSAYKDRINALHAFAENNLWLKYFEEISKTFSDDKKNWIDFENEISTVIQLMDTLINLYNDIEVNGVEPQQRVLLSKYDEKLTQILDGNFMNAEEVRAYIPTLLNDLNRLIGALEVYIFDYIGSQKIDYYNPDINEIQPDKVISFNYSDTYRRLYLFHRRDYECSFVHGMAVNNISSFGDKKDASEEELEKCIIQSTEENNMVLGINEYLPEERKSKELDFIAFKKYYQRIYKKNGNEYKKWLQQIDEQPNENGKPHTLYIFGHSLDVTDGDILREFINHDNLKTVVFYKNKQQLGQQITNLVKILTSDKMIEKVYGNNPSISFRQQRERELIEGSSFEISSDTAQVRMLFSKKQYDVEKLINKLEHKIEIKDLKYFHSQRSVISLFDALQKNGLARFYGKELLHIAYDLMKATGIYEPEKFEPENWTYGDYDGIKCDNFTRRFVISINKYNNENFVAEESFNGAGYGENPLDIYRHKIGTGKITNIEEYHNIIKELLMLFENPEVNTAMLWRVIASASRNLSFEEVQSTLKKMIKESEDVYEVIRLTHSLSESEMQEYFETEMRRYDENK